MRDISKALRVRQWAKNVLLFAGFVFAGRLRTAGENVWREAACVFLAFVCFCALSSAAYVVNDWRDIERDRQHPVKKNRPFASGRISTRGAAGLLTASLGVATASLLLLARLNEAAQGFVLAALAYLLLTLAYSFALKNHVIVDVLTLAAGFVVRVVAGCLAVPVAISPWIVFCTFCVALFIALCKRRAELLELGSASPTRGVLAAYSVEILDPFIAVAAGLTITAYSLYTFNSPRSTALSATWHDTPVMMATIPFVVYGVFRYLLLAHSTAVGGEPENMLRDVPFMVNVMLWAVLAAALTLLS
ncbi:MAG TPA: UbiA prenyltransferase family protein [Abditibacteriaceae bacterium]|jgi:4-hydroxybenzoate polyprenyltransferase